jgi:hypothetical protein
LKLFPITQLPEGIYDLQGNILKKYLAGEIRSNVGEW